MINRSLSLRFLAALSLLLPAAAQAQGTLSTLGFGYPSGQLSTRALGTGGALGEVDPLSVSNPASISYFGTSILYFQAEPEYRTLHIGGLSEKTSIARYPLIVASVPLSPSFTLGFSSSSLLDRSFETSTRGVQVLSDTSLATTNTFKSDGAIGDLRIALAWAPLSWIHLGVAAHAISGDNRINATQVFDDSTQFEPVMDTATVGYTGKAYSGGFELIGGHDWSLAGSYRRGGALSLKRGDTTISNARVPDRVAVSAAYYGIRGTTLAVRTAKDSWSNMQSLGSSSLRITDSWDTSVGADVLGPRFGDRSLQFRVGGRWRTLPFGTATSSVSEKSYSIGAGTSLARGHATLDFAAIRATRNAAATQSETSTTISVGITVRP